jgi:hypothetical protein
MTIEVLELDPHGVPTAIVAAANGDLIEVSRRFGSWQTVPDDEGRTRDVMPPHAAALQKAARKLVTA